jgi:hypothetical protein
MRWLKVCIAQVDSGGLQGIEQEAGDLGIDLAG